MSDDPGWWRAIPQPVRDLPADLKVVLALVALVNAFVFVPVLNTTPLRIVFGLPFVLFVPGYAFIAALFPEAGSESVDGSVDETVSGEGGRADTDEELDTGGGIDGIERVALSFGLSIAIVPLIGLVLNFTPWGIRLVPIMVAVSLFTLLATDVAAHRRWGLPPSERLRVPFGEWYAAGRAELLQPESRTDAALNVLLVLSLLLATASVTYAVAVPKQGEAFSELYVLTETEDGELIADDYPSNVTVGESYPIVVGVSNHEHRPTNYTVVAKLQRVRIQNNTSTVLREEELRRFQTGQLTDNETWRQTHNMTPTFTGDQLRLVYLLYRGSPAADPSIETAYLENHLFLNVSTAQA